MLTRLRATRPAPRAGFLLAVLLAATPLPARAQHAHEHGDARVPAHADTATEAGVRSDGTRLTLPDLLAELRARNPMLRAAGALVEARAAQEPSASLPPDPSVQVGVMNASLPSLSTDMPGAMAPSVEMMQMIPFPGKLPLAGRIAEQSTAMARMDAAEAWWEVRSMAAMLFYELYAADRQLEVMRETRDLLEDYRQVAQAMYAAGEGRQSDVLRAGVEVARMDADIRRMEAMRRGAAARLNGLLDRPANAPVATPALPALPAVVPAPATLLAWAEESRPLLERSRIGVDRADARADLARREIWPDLTVGLGYGQRAGDMGTERMGSAMIGLSIPVFARQRQLRMRDEANAMRQMATAELADARATVRARIGELLAELDRARTLVQLYRTEVIPQAEASVQSAFSSYRVGTVDFMTLVDAQMSLNQYRQELHQHLADYGRAIAGIEAATGRELPPTAETLTEVAQ